MFVLMAPLNTLPDSAYLWRPPTRGQCREILLDPRPGWRLATLLSAASSLARVSRTSTRILHPGAHLRHLPLRGTESQSPRAFALSIYSPPKYTVLSSLCKEEGGIFNHQIPLCDNPDVNRTNSSQPTLGHICRTPYSIFFTKIARVSRNTSTPHSEHGFPI